MRGIRGPLMLIVARARRRPGRWLLPVLGIALAAGFAGAVAAEGTVAGDRAARVSLHSLTPVDRTFSVTYQGELTPAVRAQALAAVGQTGFGPATGVALLNPVRLSGVVVRPAAVDPLSRWVAGTTVRHLGPCLPARCPVLAVGGRRGPTTLDTAGVHMVVVGRAELTSAAPLGFLPGHAAGEPPVVLTGDLPGLSGLEGLSGVYRAYSWMTLMPTAALHSWQLAATEARLARIQAGLTSGASQFSVNAPFSGLDAARAQASAAPTRLLLAGGGALAALGLFIVLAAGGLRREQQAEIERLLRAGARTRHWMAFVLGESAWVAAAGILLGARLRRPRRRGARALVRSPGGPGAHAQPDHAGGRPGAGRCRAVHHRTAVLCPERQRPAAGRCAGGRCGRRGGAGAVGPEQRQRPACAPPGAAVLPGRRRDRVPRRGLTAARRRASRPRRAADASARVCGTGSRPRGACPRHRVHRGRGRPRGIRPGLPRDARRGSADQAADTVPLDAIVAPGASFTTPLELAPWRAGSRSPAGPSCRSGGPRRATPAPARR